MHLESAHSSIWAICYLLQNGARLLCREFCFKLAIKINIYYPVTGYGVAHAYNLHLFCNQIGDSHQSISRQCKFNLRGEVVTNTHQSCQLYSRMAKVKSIAYGFESLKIIGHQNRRQIRQKQRPTIVETNWTISRNNRVEK